MAERTYKDGRVETSKYVYGNGLIGEEKTADETEEYTTYLYNHLGSTTAVTDENGMVIETYDYGAYGELLTDNTGTRRFLYNGQLGVVTDENGLYHMRARYYNTDIKRFISRDIVSGDIVNSQSINRYCYVQGNPLSYVDPFGLSPQSMWNQAGHALLDGLGFVPFLGIVADIVNAVWYAVEGNYFEMACCIVSVLPALGDVGGKALKGAGKLFKVSKLGDAGDFIKVGSQVMGNYGSLALSGTILVTNSFEIGMHLMDESYEGNVWDNVTAVGFAMIATVCGAKGLDESSKAFNALKNKPAGIGSGKVGSFLKNTWNDNRGIVSFGGYTKGGKTSALKINELPLAKPGEDLYVGTFSKSTYWNKKTGLNVTHTPHHVVQDAVSPVSHGRGITINIRKDLHLLTETYGYLRKGLTNRQHLAADIAELRKLLKDAGYGRSVINAQLNELIKQNIALGGFDK